MSDEDFLETLKSNPAYEGINIDAELGKMKAWLLTKPGRQLTRRFVVNWLNKADRPVAVGQNGNASTFTPAFPGHKPAKP